MVLYEGDLPVIPNGGGQGDIKSFSIVGDFNYWNLEKGYIDFSNEYGDYTLEKTCILR